MTDADLTLQPVSILVVVLLLSCIGCLLTSLVLRYFRLRREQRARDVDEIWRPFCFAAMVNDMPEQLPTLRPADTRIVTDIWLDCVERIRGFESTHGLVVLAMRLRLHELLLPQLRSGKTDLKLQALLALGAMKDTRALPLAHAMLDNDYPLMSLAAARALLEIDPHNGVGMVLDRLDNPGWPALRIGQLLKLAPAKVLQAAFASALASWPAARLGKLLEILHALAESEFHQVAKQVMKRFPEDARLLACILQLDDDPEVHALAVRLSQHENATLRRNALAALGRVGTSRDQALLVSALDCDDWQQQQTAARALAQLPGLQRDAALALLPGLTHESARQHWREALFLRGWLHYSESITDGALS